MIAPAPAISAMPVVSSTHCMRIAKIATSASAAAMIVAVAAPSSAHCVRIRNRALPIRREMAEVS
jgi:hypothetical protein